MLFRSRCEGAGWTLAWTLLKYQARSPALNYVVNQVRAQRPLQSITKRYKRLASSGMGLSKAVRHQKRDLLQDFKDVLPHCCRSILQNPPDNGDHLPPFLPFRVLDLGVTDSYDSRASMHVHVTTGSERAGYVALTHRWGLRSKRRMPSSTTLENFS